MLRSRSAIRQDVPLRMPRRNTSESPASARMAAPSFATRLAISLALKAFLILLLRNHDLVERGAVRRFELFGDLHARDPDDRTVPDEQRNAIAKLSSNLTINQEVFQCFLTLHAEGLEAVALAAVPHHERRRGTLR